jgi:predicted nucleic acid-binding protein
MSGIKILVDTNIIIYHFAGNDKIEKFLNNKVVYISAITYSELLSKSLPPGEEIILKDYLNSIQIIHTNNVICEIAADLRKTYRIKLPDALIAATCFFLNIPLITFDEVFNKIDHLKILKLDLS